MTFAAHSYIRTVRCIRPSLSALEGMNPSLRVPVGLSTNLVERCLAGLTRRTLTTIAPPTSPSSSSYSSRPAPVPNEQLAQVKALGMPHLEATTNDVIAKTRAPLFRPAHEMGPSPAQLAEANRIYQVLSQVLETFSTRDTTFSIKGEPIIVMEVEVSKDLKRARVYWTMPFCVLSYPADVVEQVKQRMQLLLEKRGGKLQRLVHAQLRSYYPPKLRWISTPADDVFQQSMKTMSGAKRRK